jgi:glycosyltransferase involved in cell wall biosynthesis
MSKGIITRPETTHVCYLHHPPRSFYYYETAVEWQKHLPFKIYGTLINHGLRLWDYLSSQRPDYFIANSQETKRRIEKLYRREATVIYPPVVIPKHIPAVDGKYEYYLTISRLARAKHIDVLIQAANNLKMPLKIVGTGRDEEHLKSIAGDTVEFLGSLPDNELSSVYAHAKAFLFASVDEEFGIAPVEAMGHGIPVIGFASGGVKEIIQNNSGFLYEQLTPESLSNEIEKLEHMSREDYLQMRKDARRQAEQFSVDVFEKKIHEFITKVTSH